MASKAENKVKFGLKDVHIAPINPDTNEYEEIFQLPGAVNLSLDAQGDIEPFYADDIVYYKGSPNNGYEGDLEIANTTDEFRQKILGETLNDDKVLLENVADRPRDFAMGFSIDGDKTNTLYWFYNCTVTRPSTEAATNEDSKEPKTDTLSISCTSGKDGNVRAKTSAETSEEIRTAWFTEVYEKKEAV